MPKAALMVVAFSAFCYAQQKASISGTVSSLDGQPLKGASLHLASATGKSPAYSSSSDAKGNFLFDNLEPDRYVIVAQRPGYLLFYYRGASSADRGTFNVAPGQQMTGLTLKMTPQGVIGGRITDEEGEAFPSIQVIVSGWSFASGHKQLQQVGMGYSDADGNFAIGDLDRGDYFVRAVGRSPNMFGGEIRGQQGPKEVYVTTYYPGTTDTSIAIRVHVAPGAPARGIDIRMRQTSVYRVRGTVVDPGLGKPLDRVWMALNPTDQSLLSSPQAYYRDGSFEFSAVLPGTYVIQASAIPVNGEKPATGRETISVGNSDVDGVVVRLGSSPNIFGRIDVAGSNQPQTLERRIVNLNPVDGSDFNTSGQVKADGSFTLEDVPSGVYRLNVPVPEGSYVKSVRFAGQDVTRKPLDLTAGGGGQLDIVISPNAARVTGVLHDPSPDANGQPLRGMTVTLWIPGGSDFFVSDETGPDGEFEFSGLPPGEYRIAAWEENDEGFASVAEFRSKFDSKAATVKVNELDHQTVDPPLILRDNIEAEASKLR